MSQKYTNVITEEESLKMSQYCTSIIAEAMTFRVTRPVGDSASHITRKLKKYIVCEIERAIEKNDRKWVEYLQFEKVDIPRIFCGNNLQDHAQSREGWKEELYESKPFLVPNGGDIKEVTITYKDWVWLESFISKTISTREKEIAEEIKRRKGDDDAYPIWNDTLDDIVSFILNNK